MVHWPKTVYGNVLLFLLVLGMVPIVVSVAVALSGPLVWAALAVIALTWVVLYAWRRRVEAARERAWTGSFSFGDVVARMRAREALQPAERPS
jgi:membrane protein implicated in regulation of membrane protease activity